MISQLNWKSSPAFIGWNAVLNEDRSVYLKIIYFPGGHWKLWYHDFGGDGKDELLGEFATDEDAKAYARTWVGDDESEGGDAKP